MPVLLSEAPPLMRWSQWLCGVMTERNLSERALAAILDVNQSTVHRLRLGTRAPSFTVLARLYAYLEVDVIPAPHPTLGRSELIRMLADSSARLAATSLRLLATQTQLNTTLARLAAHACSQAAD
jgi:transcriptional regulator with XRE-family HTH domain